MNGDCPICGLVLALPVGTLLWALIIHLVAVALS